MKDLVTLPGVGRKTANVVLGNAFGIPGITVDTHFGRLVRRFGWTDEEDPVKVEPAVGALFPRKEWTMLSHVLIFHGRRTCHATQAGLRRLPGRALCPSYGDGETDPVKAAKLLKYELAPGRRIDPYDVSGAVSAASLRTRPSRRGLTAAARAGSSGRRPGFFEPVRRHRRRAGGRSSVLILFGPAAGGGEDVVLTERAHTLRTQPGDVSFPGGKREDPDDAVRRAPRPCARPRRRSASTRPASRSSASCPTSTCAPRKFVVTPVLAWWREPARRRRGRPGRGAPGGAGAAVRPARPGGPVHRDAPERRTSARASTFDGLFVWGFTAGLLATVLDFGGPRRPWDTGVPATAAGALPVRGPPDDRP